MLDAKPGPSPLERASGGALPAALREAERRPREHHARSVLSRALALLDEAAGCPAPSLSPAAWVNNTASHAATIEMLDRAIRLADGGLPQLR